MTWFGTDTNIDSSDQAKSLGSVLGIVTCVVTHTIISLVLARIIIVIVFMRDNVVTCLLSLGTNSSLARSYDCYVLAITTIIDELLVFVCFQGRELSVDECCCQALT